MRVHIPGIDKRLTRTVGDPALTLIAEAPIKSIINAEKRRLPITEYAYGRLRAMADERGIPFKRMLSIVVSWFYGEFCDDYSYPKRYDRYADEQVVADTIARDYFPWEVARPRQREPGTLDSFFKAYSEAVTTYKSVVQICGDMEVNRSSFRRWAAMWQNYIRTGSPDGHPFGALDLGGGNLEKQDGE